METLKIPTSVKSLVEAQKRHDSEDYAKCFAPDAKVFDEGKTHIGYAQIKEWIGKANKKYNTVMEAVDYHESPSGGVLKAKISGSFDGSPLLLAYHFKFKDGLIASLKIEG